MTGIRSDRTRSSFRRRLQVSLAASAALATFSASETAQARCGDFGGLLVLVVAGAAAGGAVAGGIIAPAVISASDETKHYPFGRNVLYSIGSGLLFTGVYTVVDFSTDCGISDTLGGATFAVVAPASLGISVLTAVLLWVYADEKEPPPLALGLMPREGGAEVQAGFRF